jgi:phosphoribosyl-ATP pyrophosphohydrolase
MAESPSAAELDRVLERLAGVIAERAAESPQSSYTASLLERGREAILKKVGEEAVETLLAAQNEEASALVHELADLWFHLLVLMAHKQIPLRQVAEELERRMGRSGLEEKAARAALALR